MMALWIVLSKHSKKVPGSNHFEPGRDVSRSLHVSAPVFSGYSGFPHSLKMCMFGTIGDLKLPQGVRRSVRMNGVVCVYVCYHELVRCPGCIPHPPKKAVKVQSR